MLNILLINYYNYYNKIPTQSVSGVDQILTMVQPFNVTKRADLVDFSNHAPYIAIAPLLVRNICHSSPKCLTDIKWIGFISHSSELISLCLSLHVYL